MPFSPRLASLLKSAGCSIHLCAMNGHLAEICRLQYPSICYECFSCCRMQYCICWPDMKALLLKMQYPSVCYEWSSSEACWMQYLLVCNEWSSCLSPQDAVFICLLWMVLLLTFKRYSIHLSVMNGPLPEVCRMQYPWVCYEWSSCRSLQDAVSISLLWMVLLLKSNRCSIHLRAMNGHLAEICRLQYPSICCEWFSFWSMQDAITFCVQWMVILLRSAGCSIHLSIMNGPLAKVCKRMQYPSSVMNGSLSEVCRFQYPSVCYEWSSCWGLQDAASICLLWMLLLLQDAVQYMYVGQIWRPSCWSLKDAVSICLLWMVLLLKSVGSSLHLSAMKGLLAVVCRMQYPSVCYEWSSCRSLQDAVSIFMLWMALFLRSACWGLL